MFELRTILQPTDFSECSAPAFRLACNLASAFGARVVVLHVIPPPINRGEAIARLPPDSYRDQLWNEYLLRMKPLDVNVQIDYRLEDGDPANQIVRVAEKIGCDIIVLGTHGRGGLKRLVLGSVAEQVLRTAPCPVLTVKVPLRQQSSAAAGTMTVVATDAQIQPAGE